MYETHFYKDACYRHTYIKKTGEEFNQNMVTSRCGTINYFIFDVAICMFPN